MKSFIQHIHESDGRREFGANTSWDDGEGNKLTLQDLEKHTEHLPVKDIPVSSIAHLGNHNNYPEMQSRIDKVKIDKPIFVMGGKVLDGNHRLAKAIQNGDTHIKGKMFDIGDIDKKHHNTYQALFGG